MPAKFIRNLKHLLETAVGKLMFSSDCCGKPMRFTSFFLLSSSGSSARIGSSSGAASSASRGLH